MQPKFPEPGEDWRYYFTLSESEWDRVLHYTAGNFRELSRLLCHALEIAAFEERALDSSPEPDPDDTQLPPQ